MSRDADIISSQAAAVMTSPTFGVIRFSLLPRSEGIMWSLQLTQLQILWKLSLATGRCALKK